MVGKLVVLRGEREIVGVPIPCVTLGIAILMLHMPHLYMQYIKSVCAITM